MSPAGGHIVWFFATNAVVINLTTVFVYFKTTPLIVDIWAKY